MATLERNNVRCRGATLPLLNRKFNFLIFVQRAEFIALDGGEMDENVFAAIIGVIKPKPLSALNHFTKPVILLDIFYFLHFGPFGKQGFNTETT